MELILILQIQIILIVLSVKLAAYLAMAITIVQHANKAIILITLITSINANKILHVLLGNISIILPIIA